jgi:PhnB protein
MSTVNPFSRRQFAASAFSAVTLAALPVSSNADSRQQKPKRDEMTSLTPYLLFDGNCHQAMEFYQSCFGGELTVMKVKDSPVKDQMPAVLLDKTINARLTSGKLEISASDWLRPNQTRVRGNTVCLYLSGGKVPELKAQFERLSAGADVTDPLNDQFFGAYGALNDKFGVRWMFQAANDSE